MWILDFGLYPGECRSRGDLPLEVHTWLRPVQLARLQAAKAKQAPA